jgi:hypothetical protein
VTKITTKKLTKKSTPQVSSGAAPKHQEPRRSTSNDDEGFVRSTEAEEPMRSTAEARNTEARPMRSTAEVDAEERPMRSTESTAEERLRRSTAETAEEASRSTAKEVSRSTAEATEEWEADAAKKWEQDPSKEENQYGGNKQQPTSNKKWS